MGILNEWAGVAVNINALRRIEEHTLLRIHFEDEVFQSAHSELLVQNAGLLLNRNRRSSPAPWSPFRTVRQFHGSGRQHPRRSPRDFILPDGRSTIL